MNDDDFKKAVESEMQLKGPIYDVESKNTFSQIIKHVEELKALQVKDSLTVVCNQNM